MCSVIKPTPEEGIVDTKKLVVGQEVRVNGGSGPVAGRVVKIVTPCVYIETSNGQFRFNKDGKECDPTGEAYTYANNVMLGPGPWEVEEV
jgi:hypothetical protein